MIVNLPDSCAKICSHQYTEKTNFTVKYLYSVDKSLGSRFEEGKIEESMTCRQRARYRSSTHPPPGRQTFLASLAFHSKASCAMHLQAWYICSPLLRAAPLFTPNQCMVASLSASAFFLADPQLGRVGYALSMYLGLILHLHSTEAVHSPHSETAVLLMLYLAQGRRRAFQLLQLLHLTNRKGHVKRNL